MKKVQVQKGIDKVKKADILLNPKKHDQSQNKFKIEVKGNRE